MDEKAIQDKIGVYRARREEWIQLRQDALDKAAQYLANLNACAGAIEALEGLLPAQPIENVVHAIGENRG
jgi:hypothetical protein